MRPTRRPRVAVLCTGLLALLAHATAVRAQVGWIEDVSTGWDRPGTTASIDLASFTWADAGGVPESGVLELTRRVPRPAGDVAIGIGAVAFSSYTVLVDGVVIGRHGESGRGLPLSRARNFGLPAVSPSAVTDSVEVTLRLEPAPWLTSLPIAAVPVVRSVLVGSAALTEMEVQAAVARSRMHSLPVLLFAVLALAAGLYHLVLYATRPGEKGYLWFGLGALAFGANALASSPWAGVFHDSLVLLYRSTDASGHLAAAALMTFVWTVVDRPLGRASRLYRDSHLVLAGLVLVAPIRLVLASATPRLLWLGLLLIGVLVVLVSAARAGRPVARILLLGAVAVVAAEVAETLRVMGWPLPQGLPYAGFSMVLLSMAAALAVHFSRAHRELEMLRVELEAKVEERTARLEEMTRAAERANAAKGDLLATLSHELREPLKSVVAFTRLLQDDLGTRDTVSDRDRDFLVRIDRSGHFALRLVSDLLDLSRLELGRLRMEPEDVDLVRVLEEVRDLMHADADSREVTLRVDAPPSVRPARTDPVRLRQVLVNLVGNGIKFAPGGEVVLSLRAEEGVPRAIEVVDTGAGIPDDILEKIRAGRGVDGTSRGGPKGREGVGIGLRISRALCDAMGLRLEFESSVGAGTRARILLDPVAEP